MSRSDRSSLVLRRAISLALSGAALALPLQSLAQEATNGAAESQELEEVVVTGFRGSLNTAIAAKRNETAAIDVIASEDIGKFPDSNLAESMQRVPGVALSRSDGGEGRNISVRGLAPGFTKVRINGMEAAAQTGSSDIYGAGNNGRAFDFNVFPTEIFSQLAVRKTASADIEEGSLGATVDLKAPSAFDYDRGDSCSRSPAAASTTKSPTNGIHACRCSSARNSSTTLSACWPRSRSRNAIRVKWAIRRWTSCISEPTPTTSAPPRRRFCCRSARRSAGRSLLPARFRARVAPPATDCSTGNGRTSDMAAFMEVYNRTNTAIRDAAGNLVPGGGAFHPRLPRFVNSEQDTERSGGSLSLQWRPTENTTVSLDGLLSRYQQERRDNYILGLSFGRNLSNNGQPMVSIKDVEFDDNGSMTYGLFDGVDVRSEGLVDQFVSTFEQLSLDMNHQFNDSFSVHAYAGRSINTWDGPLRFQTFMDAIDTDNFEVDFRNGGTVPRISFGFDVSNPANFSYAPTPDGNQTVLGGFSLQGKPQREHHRQQHVRAGRHLADERLVEGEAGCAVPREPLQQPWLEPDQERHRHARVARGHQHRGHHDPDQRSRRLVWCGRARELGCHRPSQKWHDVFDIDSIQTCDGRVRRRAEQDFRRRDDRLPHVQLRLR